ncbi:MAG TPA: hypothetical protein VMV89_09085 [Candidatus Paceibacterota bacterium]|nr:hypothetical protein [Candidatus Paceibacterota bacterium]
MKTGNFLSDQTLFSWRNKGSHDRVFGAMIHTDYIVVVSQEDDYLNGYHLFTEKVNRKMHAGYQLHGQPFNINRVVCQAMIRVADQKNTNGHAFPENSADTTTFYQRPVHAQ